MKKHITIFSALLLGLASFSYGQTARVQIIHNSADTAARTVDIYANATRIADDLNFRQATAFLTVNSNVNIDITIQPSSSTDTTNGLFRTTINLDSNTNYVVVANGIVSATGYTPITPFGLDIFTAARDTSLGGDGEVDVLVCHGSTDAPAVDIFETSIPAGTIVDNIAYGEFQGYLSLDTADYTIQLRDSANSRIFVAYEAPLATLNAGGLALTVVASGFIDSTQNSNGRSFGLFAATSLGGDLIQLPAADIPTASAQLIHNAADTAARFVDVWLNDQLALDNFEFRNATEFGEFQAGVPLLFSIQDSGSSDTANALAQFEFNLEQDSSYILVANGIVSASGYSPATPFNIEVFVGGRETSSSMTTTDVLVFHGATDAPAVDVEEVSTSAVLVDSLNYAEFQGYANLQTLDYTIELFDATNSNSLGLFLANLSTLGLDGEAITVVASGFVDPTVNSNGESFGLWAATSAGGPLVELDATTSIFENQNLEDNTFMVYPNPSSDLIYIQNNSNLSVERYEMVNLNQQVVKSFSTANNNVINVGDLPAGIYFLKIFSAEKIGVKRVIVK